MPKPKYQIGDEVWVIENGKAVKKTITAIAVYAYIAIIDSVEKCRYGFNINALKGTAETSHWESDLFPTKEELLASL